MLGAEYIAEFLHRRSVKKVFTVTGGACAFIIDAIGRHPKIDYVCFNHEQAAAMAADAVWRVNRVPGVTVATSGPGATNLITGIACSFFDSIPSIHITGQVNKSESAGAFGANVRQAGFQETNIVDMVKPITKYAVQVNNGEELITELVNAFNIAIKGRMGPVLIDVPMNVQKEEVGEYRNYVDPISDDESDIAISSLKKELIKLFSESSRPLVLFGAGIGLAGVESKIIDWLETSGIPFVSSWGGSSYFDHNSPNYCGNIGVYGNRGANFILQNCDYLLVLGSRLDSRQRSGNTKLFAPLAKVHVIDIDNEELKKYSNDDYITLNLDIKYLPNVTNSLKISTVSKEWLAYIAEMKGEYFGKNTSTYAKKNAVLSPYDVVKRINEIIDNDAIVVPECGANLCWVYQIFHRRNHTLFTAGGNSPMGYTLPATIGAALTDPHKQVIGLLGDGGFQMNIQELQTMIHYNLNIKIVVLNNFGYGIIKQFQDSYFESRYEASGRGYSQPDIRKIARAYGIRYESIDEISQINPDFFSFDGPIIIDVLLDPNTLIEPKLEMGNPINNQFPYLKESELKSGNRFKS